MLSVLAQSYLNPMYERWGPADGAEFSLLWLSTADVVIQWGPHHYSAAISPPMPSALPSLFIWNAQLWIDRLLIKSIWSLSLAITLRVGSLQWLFEILYYLKFSFFYALSTEWVSTITPSQIYCGYGCFPSYWSLIFGGFYKRWRHISMFVSCHEDATSRLLRNY